MTISLLNILQRKFFARALANGETLNGADLDAMYADLCEANNRNVLLLRQIANVNGGIQALIGSITSFTATAAQTAFSVPTYNTATDKALAFTNSGSGNMTLLASSSVTLTSATVVTLPAQSAGATVMIVILTTGAGTTALASTSTGQGASLVGVEDAGGLITATQVEAALQEIATNLASAAYLGGVLTISQYVPKSGATMTGNLAFGGTLKVTGLAAATGVGEAVRWEQIQAAALIASLSPTLNTVYLQLVGGTMTGDINFGNTAKIQNLPVATANGQPLVYDQIGTLFGAGKNLITNGAGIVANGDAYAATVSGTYGYGLVETCKGAITGTTVAGTLTQGTGSSLGTTGYSIKWSSVTTTGAGTLAWRVYIESKDAVRLRNRTASLQFLIRHDAGAPITVVATVYKPTVVDNFAATTAIQSTPSTSVTSATNTTVTLQAIAMGDCANGIMVEIVATIGAVTAKNFEVTEMQLEPGSFASAFEYESVGVTLAKCQRVFVIFTAADNATSYLADGAGISATQGDFRLSFPVEMRAVPTAVSGSTLANMGFDDGVTSFNVATTVALKSGYGTRRSVYLTVTTAGTGVTTYRPYRLVCTSASAVLKLEARF